MTDTAEARRWYTADWLAYIRDLTTRQQSEPWVTVEVTDAAKGEVRVITKVSAPLGCDISSLESHATSVRGVAETTHALNTARKVPTDV